MNAHDPHLSKADNKQATDVDRQVGLRIVALRKAKGLSQTALGAAVGVTFQQIQKYERGLNRVGAGRLGNIARFFEVPVSTFFEEEDGADGGERGETFGFLRAPGAIEALRAYVAIQDEGVRREVLALVRSAARLDRARMSAAEAQP